MTAGCGNDFTNRNAAMTSRNLMHMAGLLKDHGGFRFGGNVADAWDTVTNARDADPDAF